jgi:hypothetical protein
VSQVVPLYAAQSELVVQPGKQLLAFEEFSRQRFGAAVDDRESLQSSSLVHDSGLHQPGLPVHTHSLPQWELFVHGMPTL